MSRSPGGNTIPTVFPGTSPQTLPHPYLATKLGPQRRFRFTINNPEETFSQEDFDGEGVALFQELGITFIVLQLERGEEGTLHYQGYLECSKKVRFTHFKKHSFFVRGNFGAYNGTPQQNVDYCTKEDSREDSDIAGPFMWGELSKQGARNDLVALRDAVRSGKRGRELFDDDDLCGAAIKYVRGTAAMVESYNVAKSRDDVVVTFHYGEPGLGKSYCCASDDAYYFDGNNGFWNGYKVLFVAQNVYSSN